MTTFKNYKKSILSLAFAALCGMGQVAGSRPIETNGPNGQDPQAALEGGQPPAVFAPIVPFPTRDRSWDKDIIAGTLIVASGVALVGAGLRVLLMAYNSQYQQ